MVSEFVVKLVQSSIGIIGSIAQTILTTSDFSEEEKLMNKHYKSTSEVATKYEKQPRPKPEIDLTLTEQTQEKVEKLEQQKPLEMTDIKPTEEKISKGTACIPCSNSHLSVASGLLDEAVRFAIRPKEGMSSDEVRRRVHKARKELDNMERIDLAPTETADLQGKEKQLADWARNNSAEIRHELTAAITPEQLEKVAAKLAKIAEQFDSEVWNITIASGGVNKNIEAICGSLNGEEKKRCEERLRQVLEARVKK